MEDEEQRQTLFKPKVTNFKQWYEEDITRYVSKVEEPKTSQKSSSSSVEVFKKYVSFAVYTPGTIVAH